MSPTMEFDAEGRAARPERFRLEGKGLIDTVGGFSICTNCGRLPPHAGCEAICAACVPPTGSCYCWGCAVAGKGASPPAGWDRDGNRLPPPCCEKGSAGIVCEHLRDALLVGIEKMQRDGVPIAEACARIAAAIGEDIAVQPAPEAPPPETCSRCGVSAAAARGLKNGLCVSCHGYDTPV